MNKMNADAKMAAFGKKAPDLFLPTTTKDTIWRSV